MDSLQFLGVGLAVDHVYTVVGPTTVHSEDA